MTLREILQTELWSKQTTRKMLSGLWRVLKPVVVVLGSAAVLLLLVYEVESHWLTKGEREAGRVALERAEKLESLCYCRCEQFAATNEEAKKAIEDARSKAWTLRDRGLVDWLELYRWDVDMENGADMREARITKFQVERHLQLHPDPESEEKLRALSSEEHRILRDELRKMLD
jgi:hypothetical protein